MQSFTVLSPNGRTDPKMFIQIAPSVVDPAASKPNRNRILLVNGLRTLLIKSKPVFSNGPRSLLINPSLLTVHFQKN